MTLKNRYINDSIEDRVMKKVSIPLHDRLIHIRIFDIITGIIEGKDNLSSKRNGPFLHLFPQGAHLAFDCSHDPRAPELLCFLKNKV